MRALETGVSLMLVLSSAAAGPEPLQIVARHATSAPASRPAATMPASPLAADPIARRQARRGTIILSDGTRYSGVIWTTLDKPLRIYVQAQRRYRDVPIAAVKRIAAEVLWERMVDDWRWKHAGSDVKVLTGRLYPARQTIYRFELAGGTSITGDVAAPLWIRCDAGGKVKRFILHKRQKGPLGKTLKQLVYVQEVVFDSGPASQGARPLRAPAATEPATSRPAASRPTTCQRQR